MSEEKTGSGVKSVQVALEVLNVVAASPEEISVTEIAHKLGLAKPSVFRHLKTLVDHNLLSQNPRTARYQLGMRLHVLGQLAANRIDLLNISAPIMHQLRDDTAMTVNLAGFRRNGTIILRSALGPSPMEISVRIGTEFPFHATSQGIVALAFGPPSRLAQVRKRPLDAITEHTITTLAQLEQEIARTRERGWAVVEEQSIRGISAVSVPIFDAVGDCVAALTLVGSTASFEFDRVVTNHLEALGRAGSTMSVQLGYRGSYPIVASG